MKDKAKRYHMVSVRIPVDIYPVLVEVRRELRNHYPGKLVTVSDAVRSLIVWWKSSVPETRNLKR